MEANLQNKTVYPKRYQSKRILKPGCSLSQEGILKLIWELRSKRAKDGWKIRRLKARVNQQHLAKKLSFRK